MNWEEILPDWPWYIYAAGGVLCYIILFFINRKEKRNKENSKRVFVIYDDEEN